MVSSLDGMIAKKDNSVSWFETAHHYEKGISMEDMTSFLKTIDCYIMGANTYAHALALSKSYGWAYGDTPVIVVTHKNVSSDKNNITFFSGDLEVLVHQLLKPAYKNVWLVGGAMLAKEFIRLQLADQIRLSVLPIILGEGKLFFDKIEQERLLQLKEVTTYKTGMVELWYAIKKD